MKRQKKQRLQPDDADARDRPAPDDESQDDADDGARDDEETAALANAAAQNGVEPPDTETADVFVALHVRNEIIVRSTEIVIEPTFTAFWNAASEWAWMEIRWWCDEHDMTPEETDAMIDSISPDLFHIELKPGRLRAVRDDLYRKIKSGRRREARQFAFLDTEAPFDKVAPLLRDGLEAAHGAGTVPKTLRLTWPEPASA